VYFLCRLILFSSKFSDAGTNSKVGGQGSGEKVGAPIQIFFVVPVHFFGYESTISRFDECFRDGSTVWSFLVGCSSAYGAPCAQPFVKVGHVTPMPYGVGAAE